MTMKISELDAATALSGTEAFEAVQSGDSVQVTAAQILAYAAGSSINWIDEGWAADTVFAAYDALSYGGSSYIAVAASTGVVPGTDATKWALMAQKGDPGAAGAQGTPGGSYGAALLSGGIPFYTGSGLVYTIPAATYIINGLVYSSPETNVTLATADATHPRIDAFALTTSNTAIKVDGTAAANPAEAGVEPSTQLKIGVVLVAAGATEPTIATTSIYAEDAEWTATVSGAPMNKASTSNPHAGTKCIEATSAVAGNYVNLSNGSAFDTSTRNTLPFFIRSKGAWPNSKSLVIQFYNSAAAVGTPVTLKTGAFNFNSGTTGAYQLINIPLAAFGVIGVTVTAIRFTVTGGSSAIGFYLDDISMQGGVIQTTPSDAMRWKGSYSAAVQYQLNDVVLSGNGIYVANTSGLGSTPPAAMWTPLTRDLTSGTAFPSSPVADQRFYRTDLDLRCYYDGTRWLTDQQFSSSLTIVGTTMAHPLSVNQPSAGNIAGIIDNSLGQGVYVERALITTYLNGGTSNASNKWAVQFVAMDGAGATTSLGALFDTSADAASAYVSHNVTVGAVVSDSYKLFSGTFVKTGAPGNLYALPIEVVYRLIVT